MFARISDLFNYFFGTHLDIPIQSYGFMLAISFLAAGWILMLELRRKEKNGQIPFQKKRIERGAPAGVSEVVTSAFFGFLLGWKGLGIIADYAAFSKSPQDFILSGHGYLLPGIVAAGAFGYLTYASKKKKELKPPVSEEMIVHPYQLTGNIVIIAAIFGILGSKLFDTIEHLDDLVRDPIGTIFSFSGLSFFGGLIVAAVAVILYAHKNKIRFPHIIDAAAPAIILAYAIGRIGCQLAGDGCWGVINTHPKPGWLSFLPDWMWSFTYPHNVINEGSLIPHCIGDHCYALQTPVFPAPFYETVLGLVIFFILWGTRKRIIIPGYLFCLYLILNGTERFFIEKIRVNKVYDVWGFHMTQAEMIAILLVVIGLAGFWYFRRQHKLEVDSSPVTNNHL
jgi:phosphatidylglycerol---prolipoprotein diacylglyceryl transferase